MDMKDLLRSIAYRSGLLGLLHRWRNRRALTVLMFHRVLPDGDARLALAERDFTLSLSSFQRVLNFVARHYQVVRLEDVQRWVAGQGNLPPCPVLLTFDDGWRDTLVHAAPELQHRGWSAVLFLASEVPSLQAPRWWQDALVQAMAEPGARSRLWTAAGFDSEPNSPAGVAWGLTTRLAAWPESQRLAWLDRHAPGVTDGVRERQMLTTTELAQLEPAGLEFAGHGHWNPALVAQAQQAGFELIFSSEPTLTRRTSGADGTRTIAMPLGRIHLPESEWTCRNGQIDPSRLASFLFGRAHALALAPAIAPESSAA
jgi:peptidoglycan/xylan/chitin deacetylase (PgdA/CDA1 family)